MYGKGICIALCAVTLTVFAACSKKLPDELANISVVYESGSSAAVRENPSYVKPFFSTEKQTLPETTTAPETESTEPEPVVHIAPTVRQRLTQAPTMYRRYTTSGGRLTTAGTNPTAQDFSETQAETKKPTKAWHEFSMINTTQTTMPSTVSAADKPETDDPQLDAPTADGSKKEEPADQNAAPAQTASQPKAEDDKAD